MRNSQRFLSKIFLHSPLSLILFLCLFLVISFKYSLNLADFGDYIRAGSLIADRINPYESLMYANSPVSALFFYLISLVVPFSILPIMIHLLNMAGIVYFLKWYLDQKLDAVMFFILSLLLVSGVGRALFGNVQVTGITLGLVAVAFTVNTKYKFNFLPIFFLLLAFEIKAQISIPFIVLYIFQGVGAFKKISIFIFSSLSIHALVEMYYGGNLHLSWLKKVIRYSQNSILESSYEISIWKSINEVFEQEKLIRVLSTLTVLVFLLLITKFSNLNSEKALFLALVFPIFNSYVHLYDYIGVLLIATKYVSRGRFEKLILLLPFLFIFPLSKNLFFISILIELILVSIVLYKFKNNAYIGLVFGLFIYQLSIYPHLIDKNQEIQMSFYLSVPTLLLTLYTYRNVFKNTSLLNN